MLSCVVLYTFLLLIMLHPFPAIDSFLEVNFVFLICLDVGVALAVLALDLNSRNRKDAALERRVKVYQWLGSCMI